MWTENHMKYLTGWSCASWNELFYIVLNLFGSNSFDYQTSSQFQQYHAYVQRSSVFTAICEAHGKTDRQIHKDSGQTTVTRYLTFTFLRLGVVFREAFQIYSDGIQRRKKTDGCSWIVPVKLRWYVSGASTNYGILERMQKRIHLMGFLMGEDSSHWIDGHEFCLKGHRPAWCVGCAFDTLVMSSLCCLLCRLWGLRKGIPQDKMKPTAPVCWVDRKSVV